MEGRDRSVSCSWPLILSMAFFLLLAPCSLLTTDRLATPGPVFLPPTWTPTAIISTTIAPQPTGTSPSTQSASTAAPAGTPTSSLDVGLPIFEGIGEMFTATDGWAMTEVRGGVSTRVFHTSDGATSWRTVDRIEVEEGEGATMLLLPFSATRAYVLVLLARSGSGQAQGVTEVQIRRTSDAGATWDAIRQVIQVEAGFSRAFFLDPERGWLLVHPGGLDPAEEDKTNIYRTVDGGLTWSLASSLSQALGAPRVPGLPRPDCHPTGIVFNGSSNGWIAGGCNADGLMLYRTQDGGITWSLQALPIPPGKPADYYEEGFFWVDSPVFVTPQAGTLLVLETSHSGDSYMFATRDGGGSWRLFEPPGARRFFDAVSAQVAWSNGAMYLYLSTDGWATWDIIDSCPVDTFADIEFVDAKNGWVQGWHELYSTRDGGLTWTKLDPVFVDP